MGAHLVQDGTERITIDEKDELDLIQPLTDGLSKRSPTKAGGTDSISVRYWKDSLRWQSTSLVIAYHASKGASKCTFLRLHRPGCLNYTLHLIRKCPCAITFFTGTDHGFKLQAISYASMCTIDDKQMCVKVSNCFDAAEKRYIPSNGRPDW